ncbi:hypothetical protein STEG23_022500, partial [Scotinomys teguina]
MRFQYRNNSWTYYQIHYCYVSDFYPEALFTSSLVLTVQPKVQQQPFTPQSDMWGQHYPCTPLSDLKGQHLPFCRSMRDISGMK